MTEVEWRSLGVQQSRGWVHYLVHSPGKCVCQWWWLLLRSRIIFVRNVSQRVQSVCFSTIFPYVVVVVALLMYYRSRRMISLQVKTITDIRACAVRKVWQ